MGKAAPATQAKRQRERNKQERQQIKDQERLARKEQKRLQAENPSEYDGDPDLAGIVAGPQPIPEDY